MFADVRWVGFLPPLGTKTNLILSKDFLETTGLNNFLGLKYMAVANTLAY
jgi:hypothetical protein